MKKLYFSLLALANFSVFAQVSTPNTGVNWNLDSLVANFPAAFSLDTLHYAQIQDLTISKMDTLELDGYNFWIIDSNVRVTVEGAFIIHGNLPGSNLIMTSFDTSSTWDGLRFEDSSFVSIKKASISYSGGLRVLTENFSIDSSFIRRSHSSGTSPSAVINISRGKPSITNCYIYVNEQTAIGSGANQEVSAYIKNCVFTVNNRDNGNRPQINLGPTHPNDTTYILDCLIFGDSALTKAGGISVSSLLGGYSVNAVIENNLIQNNRYGITLINASYGRIINNEIIDNNIEGLPLSGGSGINLLNSSNVIAAENLITGNLWGITLQGTASINLGDTSVTNYNIGHNTFYDNGNGGVTYALYNNTTNTIMALNNCWTGDSTATLTDAENVIFHLNDDNTLGEVHFDPIWDCTEANDSTSSLNDLVVQELKIYPNPSSTFVNFHSDFNGVLAVHNMSGVLVREIKIYSGENRITHHLNPGVYIVSLNSNEKIFRSKLIVK